MNYLDSLRQTTNTAYTENGALSNLSTLNDNLDFFSRAGAMRGNISGAVALFEKAYAEDPQMAVRCLFYLRDVRGGQGERNLFRKCIMFLSEEHRKQVIRFIAEYGRWDDLFSLPMKEIHTIVSERLERDRHLMIGRESVSLLAKWMPSENASSKVTQSRAKELIKLMKISERKYRKLLVDLRTYLDILEQKMSAKKWDEIDYSKLPSQAHRKHVKAFKRHDEERYTKYLEQVKSGEKKINTSTLYTYEVYDMVKNGQDDVATAMWNNLPDYTNGKNALVIADVSGSMNGRPMSVSVSLAMYFAERNKGTFNGYFMTFSSKPRLQKVTGSTLAQKIRNLESSEWGMSTNLEAAFKAILDAAIKNKASQEEMPAILYVISDMQFNQCVYSNNTNFVNAEEMFKEAGYKLPHVVFWNVNARNESPATMFDNGVTLISGSSQSTFRYAVEGKSPMEFMNEVLNSKRYAQIVLE